MAEPPAVVARTFEFAGGLQLHRLVEPVRFHCVRCQQDKTAMRIATMGGDWTQTICGRCFYPLRRRKPIERAKGPRKKEKKAAKAALKAAAAAAGQGRAAARRRIDRLPDDLAPELIDACLHASRRIRLERQVEYPRPVVLECDVGELTLLPVAGTENRLLMPFRVNNGTEILEGSSSSATATPYRS